MDLRYRLLMRNEPIQPTDEFLTDDAVNWAPITSDCAGRAFIGKPFDPVMTQPVRRPTH